MANQNETDSILESVKKDLGASEWDDAFDDTLIREINSVFQILGQLGIGPDGGFQIKSKEDRWEDFISDGEGLESVKTYVYKKVQNIFDPPSSSFVLDANKAICDELEWRLNVSVDPG